MIGLFSTFCISSAICVFMVDTTPSVVLESRDSVTELGVDWDETSSVLSMTLHYFDSVPKPSSLADAINQRLRIDDDSCRLVVGDLEILPDRNQRPATLTIRTNPQRWLRRSLIPMPESLDPVFARILADYDDNNIASYDVPTSIGHDAAKRQVSISFGDYRTSKWASLAEGLAIGLTHDDLLSELRLNEFDAQ